ncbi:MAG TPA: M3 family oligoendopeptidase [bacterium]|nr:M3 family oligoendopeptidase [bacterium]
MPSQVATANVAADAPPAPASSAEGVRWRLDDLYGGPDDPALAEDQRVGLDEAEAFAAEYRGHVGGLDAAALARAVARLEALQARAYRPLVYAHLLFSGDTGVARHGALLQAARERHTAIHERLLFFMLEWQAVPQARAQGLLADPALARHGHWLERARELTPYTLSEPEERILAVKANTGTEAFQRLFDELIAGLRCPLEVPGEPAQSLPLERTLALLYHPERPRREAAARAVTDALAGPQRTLTLIFNTLVLDHADDDRLRHRPHMMLARNLANEIDQAGVDTLLAACDAGMPLVARYYRLKQRLLGLERLMDYDRYAPAVPELPTCTFAEARALVLEAYADFAPEAAAIAGRFFEERWIDAELRPGKQGGGFSAGTLPEAHPYILVNYTDNLRDVMVLAHELGHGIHQYLSRERGFFLMHTPLTTAETASVFGEMLAFRKLMAMHSDPRVRLGLLCGKLEDIFATVFRQAAMTRFEQKLHAARREQGDLDAATIGSLWMEANRAMFGDSVELSEGYASWWGYIPHFVHTPFYCYAYSFGELLVLALYQQYEEQGAAFIPRYLELLAAGGSQSPAALLARMELDITDPGFWQKGLTLLEAMLAQAEALADSTETAP